MASKTEQPVIAISDEDVVDYYERFRKEKRMVEGAQERLARLKAALMAYAEKNGIKDDAGHQWVELEDGGRFKRQVSKRETLNEERISAWLDDVGRIDECVKEVQVFDEEKFWLVVDEEELTPEEIDQFYDTIYTYSFIPEV